MNPNDDFEKQLDRLYNVVINNPEKEIERMICKKLDKCGLMYRIFSRIKEKASVHNKISKKRDTYLKTQKKMQDMIGIRIVLYFRDDVDICIDILNALFEVDNYEYDQLNTETFKPQRINYVYRTPNNIKQIPDDISDDCLIDNTFEVQIRTIFSEGWHEVEHDIRYKYLDEWDSATALSRELNGIMAVLEVCDHNIMSICDQLAYKKYKEKEWDSMLRNKFRLRFIHVPLDKNLHNALSDNAKLAKALFRYDRERLIRFLAESNIPRTCNNIVYIINEIELHDKTISALTPSLITDKCKKWMEQAV
ncbi:MAG: (p)ppGpp synthetase [Lachnospiraceae bacterium]|nr:(p)ppGpp synthetase [Lachnospiraceae bacterium]MCM1215694.1 (p)ppGpp synthetase [Lachnospiraceae bacterium]MCM1238439.1 (p)ppGpp synthetase [Lachnospiraceae bacterium]